MAGLLSLLYSLPRVLTQAVSGNDGKQPANAERSKSAANPQKPVTVHQNKGPVVTNPSFPINSAINKIDTIQSQGSKEILQRNVMDVMAGDVVYGFFDESEGALAIFDGNVKTLAYKDQVSKNLIRGESASLNSGNINDAITLYLASKIDEKGKAKDYVGLLELAQKLGLVVDSREVLNEENAKALAAKCKERLASLSQKQKEKLAIELLSQEKGVLTKEELSERIQLVHDGKLEYRRLTSAELAGERFGGNSDTKFAGYKIFYFEKATVDGHINVYVFRDKSADEVKDYFRFLKKMFVLFDPSDNLKFLTYKYISDQSGEVIDQNLFKRLLPTAKKREETLIRLGLLDKTDKNNPSTANYYMPAGVLLSDIISENKKDRIDGTVYVRDELSLQDPDVLKLIKAGVKVEVNKTLSFSGLALNTPDIVYVRIKTNLSDDNDFNLRKMSQVVNQVIYRKGDAYRDTQYMSLDAFIMLSDEIVLGAALAENIKKFKATSIDNVGGLELNSLSVPDNLMVDSGSLLSSQAAFESGMRNKTYIDMVKSGTVNAYLTYTTDKIKGKDQVKSIKIVVVDNTDPQNPVRHVYNCMWLDGDGKVYSIDWDNEMESAKDDPAQLKMINTAKGLLGGINELLAQNHLPLSQLGSPELANPTVAMVLKSLSESKSGIIDRDLSVNRTSGAEMLDNAVTLQLESNKLEQLSGLKSDNVVPEMVYEAVNLILVKGQDKDNKVSYRTPEECKKITDAVMDLLAKPAADRKAFIDALTNNGKPNEDMVNILRKLGDQNLIDLALNVFSACNDFTPQETDAFKAVMDLLNKGVKPSDLRFMILKAKSALIPITPNLIGALENGALSGNNKMVHDLDEIIFKSPAGQYLFNDKSYYLFHTFDLPEEKDKFAYLETLIGYFEYQASNGDLGQKEAKEAASRLRTFFYEGGNAKKSDIEAFVRYLYLFDAQNAADEKIMQDKKDIALKRADNFKPFEFEYNISSVKVASDDKQMTFSVILGQKDEKLKQAVPGKSITSVSVDTLNLFGEGKYAELVWLNLEISGSKGNPADAFNGKAGIYDPATFKTVPYIDSSAVEKIIEKYGKGRETEQNPAVPYVHFLTDLDVITASNMLAYKDANGKPVFAQGTPWYGLLNKIRSGGDAGSRVSLEDIKFNGATAADYMRSPEGVAELDRKLSSVKGLTQDERALAKGMILDVTNAKVYYADLAGLKSSEIKALEEFNQHLKKGDFGSANISDDDINRGQYISEEDFYAMLSVRGRAFKGGNGEAVTYDALDGAQKRNVSALFNHYKQAIDIFSRIALTQAMSIEIAPEERQAKGSEAKSGLYSYAMLPKRFVVAMFKDSFSAVKTTMRPTEDIRGMGTDVLVSFAIKSKLFPEMLDRSYSNLLSYSILSAFCESSKNDGLHYEDLSTKLNDLIKYNDFSQKQGELKALLEAVNAKDSAKIKEALKPFFADPKVFDAILGKKEIKNEDLKPVYIEMIKYQRLYKVDMDYLVSDRWDKPALEALRDAIRGSNDEKRVNWAFAEFVAEAMGGQLINPLDNTLSPFNKLADELDAFLKDHESISWSGLNPTLEVSDGKNEDPKAEIALKQHIAQYIQMIPPSELGKSAPSEKDLSLHSVERYPRSITTLVTPANVGIYQKFIKISNGGGVEGLESAFSLARIGYDTTKWNEMTTDDIRGVLDDTRAAYEQLGCKGILRSLSHNTIVGLMAEDEKAKDISLVLNVSGSKVFTNLPPTQDIIFEMITKNEIDFVFKDEKARETFHHLSALAEDKQKEKIIEMVSDGDIRLNPSSTVKFNPWGKEYGILADKDAKYSDDTSVNKMYVWLDSLDNKGMKSVNLQVYTQKGSLDRGVVKILERVPLANRVLDRDEGMVIRGMNDLLDGEFALFFPSDKQEYSQTTKILTIDEMEEKAVAVSAMQNCKDPATLKLLANGALQAVDMLLSPANGKDLENLWNNSGGRGTWAEEVAKGMAKEFDGMGISKEVSEPLVKYITFRLKYGVFMHLNVAYGIPFQIAAQDISTPEGFSKAVALSMIPLFIFPRWASIWYTDAWNKAFKQGDLSGGLFEFWMVNTMAARRVGGMPSMVDMQLMTMNGMYRGGRTLVRGVGEFAAKPVYKKISGDMEYSFNFEEAKLNTLKKGWYDPTFLEDIQGSERFSNFVSNKYVSWVGRWVLKGPFAELEGRLEEMSPAASQWHSPQNLIFEKINNWSTRKPLGKRAAVNALAQGLGNPISLPGRVIELAGKPVATFATSKVEGWLGVEQDAKQLMQLMVNDSFGQKMEDLIEKQGLKKELEADPFDEILDPSKSSKDIAAKIVDADLMRQNASLQNEYMRTEQEYRAKIFYCDDPKKANELIEEGNDKLEALAKGMEKARKSYSSDKKRMGKAKAVEIEALRSQFEGNMKKGIEAAQKQGIAGKDLRKFEADYREKLKAEMWNNIDDEAKAKYRADAAEGLSNLNAGGVDYLGKRAMEYVQKGPHSELILNDKLAKQLLSLFKGDEELLGKYVAYKEMQANLKNEGKADLTPEEIRSTINDMAQLQKLDLDMTEEDLANIIDSDNKIKGAINGEVDKWINVREGAFKPVVQRSAEQGKLLSAGNNLVKDLPQIDAEGVLQDTLKGFSTAVKAPKPEASTKTPSNIEPEPTPAYLGPKQAKAPANEGVPKAPAERAADTPTSNAYSVFSDNGNRVINWNGMEARLSPKDFGAVNELAEALRAGDESRIERALFALRKNGSKGPGLTNEGVGVLRKALETEMSPAIGRKPGEAAAYLTSKETPAGYPGVGKNRMPKKPVNPMAEKPSPKPETAKPDLKIVPKPVEVDKMLIEDNHNAKPEPKPKVETKPAPMPEAKPAATVTPVPEPKLAIAPESIKPVKAPTVVPNSKSIAAEGGKGALVGALLTGVFSVGSVAISDPASLGRAETWKNIGKNTTEGGAIGGLFTAGDTALQKFAGMGPFRSAGLIGAVIGGGLSIRGNWDRLWNGNTWTKMRGLANIAMDMGNGGASALAFPAGGAAGIESGPGALAVGFLASYGVYKALTEIEDTVAQTTNVSKFFDDEELKSAFKRNGIGLEIIDQAKVQAPPSMASTMHHINLSAKPSQRDIVDQMNEKAKAAAIVFTLLSDHDGRSDATLRKIAEGKDQKAAQEAEQILFARQLQSALKKSGVASLKVKRSDISLQLLDGVMALTEKFGPANVTVSDPVLKDYPEGLIAEYQVSLVDAKNPKHILAAKIRVVLQEDQNMKDRMFLEENANRVGLMDLLTLRAGIRLSDLSKYPAVEKQARQFLETLGYTDKNKTTAQLMNEFLAAEHATGGKQDMLDSSDVRMGRQKDDFLTGKEAELLIRKGLDKAYGNGFGELFITKQLKLQKDQLVISLATAAAKQDKSTMGGISLDQRVSATGKQEIGFELKVLLGRFNNLETVDHRPALLSYKPNSYDPDVYVLQEVLSELGYLDGGQVNGKFGDQTAKAIGAFRKSTGMPEEEVKKNNSVGSVTLRELDTAYTLSSQGKGYKEVIAKERKMQAEIEKQQMNNYIMPRVLGGED